MSHFWKKIQIPAKHRFFAGAFLIVFGLNLQSQQLQQSLNQLVNHNDFRPASIGIHIVSLSDNQEILNYQAHKKLIPASITKLITTYNALLYLKPNFTFETQLYIDGYVKNDTLNGYIVIKGGGDPALQSRFFQNHYGNIADTIAQILKHRNIKHINGAVITDYSVFDFPGTPATWLWSDYGNYYGTSPCGINYRDNSIAVYLQSKSMYDKVKIVKTIPNNHSLQFKNLLQAKKFRKDSAYAYCFPFSDTVLISGAIPENRNSFKIKIAHPRPFKQLQNDIIQALENYHISLTETNISASKKDNFFVRKTFFSPPLSEIVKSTNLYSNNLFAETLNFYLGFKRYGKGNYLNGINAQKELLSRQKLPLQEITLHDGCGLSPMNAISANFFTQLLQNAAQQPFFKVFKASLPVSGMSGTLAGFGKNSILAGNLRAKSGYMEGVRTYAGYFTGKSGKTYCFCIMINHYNGSAYQAKKKIETFLVQAAQAL